MIVFVEISLPAFYYSLNTEQYARFFIRKYHPELRFSHMKGRYAMCEREQALSLPFKNRQVPKPRNQNKLL